jgi:copper resistance protein D
VRRWSPVAAAILVVAAAALAAWALAYPAASLADLGVRACTDVAAVLTVGLSAVGWFDIERHRDELVGRATAPLAVSAAGWLLAEVVRWVEAAAQAAAVPVTRLPIGTAVDFGVHTDVGRAGLTCAAAAALVAVTALAAPRTPPFVLVAAGLAAAGLTARTLSGHLADDPVGGAAIAVHALAAAAWCGGLAALTLTVRRRGQWARVLPRFSRVAAVSLGVLVAAGTVGALLRLDDPGQLLGTGYGRILSAKLLATAALAGLAWRYRTGWLTAARAHRSSARESRSRSLVELALMAVALTLAAALAVTG